jgi:diguanylate cyclase (GGDEF)-like protein
LDDDEDFGIKLKDTLGSYGYVAHVEHDIAHLERAVAHHDPLALIVDMDFFGHRLAGANQVSLWRHKDGAPLPVIFISQHDSFDLRLASVRAGGNHFLHKPLDIPRLIALLHSELNLAPVEPYRVMIVDDDQDLLDLYDSILGGAGYSVRTADDAQNALSLLDQFQPELVLIDVSMPVCNGIELGRIIRQHEEFSTIPLLFMSAVADTDMQLACARLANDEFISKPIEPWRLLMMVKSRVMKGRQLRSLNRTLTAPEADMAQDPLTALPKLAEVRRALNGMLQQPVQGDLALIKMDLCDFHTINNLHGQYFGDEVLQRVAWALGQRLRETSMLSREAGDEFLILSKDHSSQEALDEYVKELIQAVNQTDMVSEQGSAPLSVDVGVAISMGDNMSADELIDRADMALFKAKAAQGAELIYFNEELHAEQRYRFNLEQSIIQGLEDDQFIAAYQPIFSVEAGRIVGFEALARWQHPERGLLGPGEFIPLMEDRGLISRLTEQIISRVVPQLSYWHSQHPDLFLSLNLSARDIQKPLFIENLTTLIHAHKLMPEKIVLEITESLLLADWAKASGVLESLRSLGVRLALDDFGTGYSSLSYLHRINADKLKIDRSFIEHWSQTGDARLLRTIVHLGQSMSMTVIAEGVEEKEELAFLKEIGCHQYQGFLSARPMLPEEIGAGDWLL